MYVKIRPTVIRRTSGNGDDYKLRVPPTYFHITIGGLTGARSCSLRPTPASRRTPVIVFLQAKCMKWRISDTFPPYASPRCIHL